MKLIIQNDRIVGTATDDYTGPDAFIDEPEGFDAHRLAEYRLVDDELVLPEPLPDVISRAQGKSTLIHMNLWSAVLQQVDAIEDATEKELALVALNDTQEWRRDSLFLNSMSNALGLTSEQLDQLFIDAAGVVF